jgi:hypothetical protein
MKAHKAKCQKHPLSQSKSLIQDVLGGTPPFKVDKYVNIVYKRSGWSSKRGNGAAPTHKITKILKKTETDEKVSFLSAIS